MEVKYKQIKNEIDFKKAIKSLINESLFEAAQINVKDIKQGLDTSQGPRVAITKLKNSTIKAKRKKGYLKPSTPLIATGMMRRLPPVKMKGNKAIISIANKRAEIAQYHERGAGRLPKREFFDIYPQTLMKINKMLQTKLVQLYRRL